MTQVVLFPDTYLELHEDPSQMTFRQNLGVIIHGRCAFHRYDSQFVGLREYVTKPSVTVFLSSSFGMKEFNKLSSCKIVPTILTIPFLDLMVKG